MVYLRREPSVAGKRAQGAFGTLLLATIRNNQKKQPARHKAFWANERARSERFVAKGKSKESNGIVRVG